MLIVYHSNRLDVLADQLAELLRQPPVSPFTQETVIVQSLGMARWLSLHLAQRLGVCAHVHFPLPAAFIWEILQRVLPDVPDSSAFAPDVLTWRLAQCFGEPEDAPCLRHGTRTIGVAISKEYPRRIYSQDWQRPLHIIGLTPP